MTGVQLTEIFAMHGIVERPQADVFCHRNMLDTDRFCATLQSQQKFVPLPAALEGRGRALTIDDGTVAGARAALLARRFGHAVTLFINPWQVQDGRAYAFSWLNALLDQTREKNFSWYGQAFNLTTLKDRQRFRSVVKGSIRKHVLPEENYELIEGIRIRLAIDQVHIPDFLSCLSLKDLHKLRDAGVDIQNHYWSHLDPSAHPPAQFAIEFHKSRKWISDSLGISSKFFASPFGEFFPHRDFLVENNTICLLLHDGYPAGAVDRTTVNRVEL